jgi:hypothetical protein
VTPPYEHKSDTIEAIDYVGCNGVLPVLRVHGGHQSTESGLPSTSRGDRGDAGLLWRGSEPITVPFVLDGVVGGRRAEVYDEARFGARGVTVAFVGNREGGEFGLNDLLLGGDRGDSFGS